MKKFWGVILLIAGAMATYFAIDSVLWQHRAIHNFSPVDAQITQAHVESHRGSKGSVSYSPEITYTYTYNDHTYTSTRALTFTHNGDRSWANRIVSQYGGTTFDNRAIEARPFKATAYLDPNNPEDAILVREYSIQPYIFGAVSLLVAGIGAGLFTGVLAGTRKTMAALALDDSGWQLLLPARNLRKSFRDSALILAGTFFALVPLLLHWTFIAGQQIFITIFLAAGVGEVLLVMLILMLRRWSLSRHISDARVRIRPVPLQRGEPFAMEVEADAFSPLRVKQARCRIICVEHYRERRGNKTTVGTRKKGDKTALLTDRTEIPAGQALVGKGELLFEKDNWPPTTNTTIKIYPHYTWELHVEAELEGMVDYRGVFPLEVD